MNVDYPKIVILNFGKSRIRGLLLPAIVFCSAFFTTSVDFQVSAFLSEVLSIVFLTW